MPTVALRHRSLLAAAAATIAAAVPVTAAAAPSDNGCANRNNNQYSKLLECVRVEGVKQHLAALQAIADANGGTRADQTPGYAASVAYVEATMTAAGWSVTVEDFVYDDADVVLHQDTPDAADWPANPATGTGEGTLTDTPVVPVDINLDTATNRANSSGCEATDFAGFPAGAIALLQRGTCSFAIKALNAEAAGAGGVVLFNQGNDGGPDDRFGAVNPTLGGPDIVAIPTVGTSFAAGESLARPGATADLTVDFVQRTSQNVIAELPGANGDNVVMAGAHLDSVPAGPGINDNGSGSAALLEVAENLANHRPQNTVRFAWWGAEEAGLLGSTAWVAAQSPAERDRIALYLNFDMVGSPNYVFQVYDANQSTFPAPAGVPIPDGSAAIETVFESFYTSADEPYDDSQFSGRSDYQAFILNGIPSSGLFTGAEQLKTAEQAGIWGGTAGVAFDPCYHQACDSLGNVDDHALDVNSDAIAFAVLTFAYSTESVNGVPGKRVPGKYTIPAPAGPEGTFATGGGGLAHDHDPVGA